MKFKKRSMVIEVDAEIWFQNGDHSEDEYEKGTVNEGKIVRRFRNPEIDGWTKCKECGYLMHDHGWIDAEEGYTVCPGDWIVKDLGKFYPRKPVEFEDLYEKV